MNHIAQTPNQLAQRFPYQFTGNHLGLSIPKGWFDGFAQLCEDIDQVLGLDKRGFYWRQLKEKFGASRWYFCMAGQGDVRVDFQGNGRATSLVAPAHDNANEANQIRTKIRALVARAEGETHHQCIVCGEQATLDRSSAYVLVLCSEHVRQRAAGTMESPWFEEDES